jgi:proline iminopeptidase
MLPVSDGNLIHWETSGHPRGRAVLYLHGGPGAGMTAGYRRLADPARHLLVGLDQRGCGRSRPLVTEPDARLDTNTTPALVADLEVLRAFLGVERWVVLGLSWGTTLALAYTQAYPERVVGLVLGAVTTTSTADVSWVTEEMGRIFPREWDDFAAAVPREGAERVVDAYARVLAGGDTESRARAAEAWCRWEDVHVSLDPAYQPNPRYLDPGFRDVFATLVAHYWSHSGFVGDQILARMDGLSSVPGVLIHGRLDVSSPLSTAWRLHQTWPGSELVVVDGEGHGGAAMMDRVAAAVRSLAG